MYHNQLEQHLDVCLFHFIHCRHTVHGCTYQGKRSDEMRHVERDCQFERLMPFIDFTETSVLDIKSGIDRSKRAHGQLQASVELLENKVRGLLARRNPDESGTLTKYFSSVQTMDDGLLPRPEITASLHAQGERVEIRSAYPEDIPTILQLQRANPHCVHWDFVGSLLGSSAGSLGEALLARSLDGIVSLDFSCVLLSDGGCETLCVALASARTITTLRLDSCGLGMKSGLNLGQALSVNTTLLYLYVGNHRVSSHASAGSVNDLNAVGCAAIFRALKVNRTLQLLDVSGVHLREEQRRSSTDPLICTNRALDTLTEALGVNIVLKALDISWNDLDTSHIEAFAHCLLRQRGLRKCDISHNRIYYTGGMIIAKMLLVNTHLSALNVTGCCCTEDKDGTVQESVLLALQEAVDSNGVMESFVCPEYHAYFRTGEVATSI
jgi:hypothetical protein